MTNAIDKKKRVGLWFENNSFQIMSALVQKYWSDHRVASVISLVLLFLGLMAKPWTLILVLLVAFGGPVLQRFDGFSESPIGAWRRSNWAISALAVAVALLATSGTDAGEGLLILALLPVAWTLAKDKTIFNRSSETPNKATRTVDDVSLKVEKDNSSVESKPSPQLQEKSSREELVGYIVENQSQPSNWLALKLGYKTTEGKADLYRFYNELMLSLGFSEELDSSTNKGDEIVDFIHQEQGGSSPILNGNEITGCYRVRMSREARIHNWDEEDWSEVQEQTEEMGLDGPYEVHESNSNELRCSAEDNFLDACTGFQSLGGKFHDLLRIGYQGLGDNAYGMMINEHLEENEKHPFYYVELAQKLGLIADKKVISNNGAIHNTDVYAHQDQSEGSDGSDKIIESKPSPQLNEGLTGKELLDKIDSLGDVSTAKLLEACGYIIMEDDGIERRYYTKFYEALLQAKGITESIASDPEQNILEREQTANMMQQVDVGIKTGSDLAATIKFNKDEDATWFALNYGYLKSDGQADLPAFYDNLLISLGFPQVFDEDNDNVAEFIHENGGGCSPMLDGRKLVGRFGIRISGVARDYDWNETEWQEVQEETGENHLDSPYEVQKSTSFELECDNNYSLESACAEFGGKFIDLFRPSYNNLSDDENGETIDTFLDNYEEEPIYYVELAEKLGFITINEYSKDSEHNNQPNQNNSEGYADGKENVERIGSPAWVGNPDEATAWARVVGNKLEIDLLNTECYGLDDERLMAWIEKRYPSVFDVSPDGSVLVIVPRTKSPDALKVLSRKSIELRPFEHEEDCLKFRFDLAQLEALGYHLPLISEIGAEVQILRWVDGSWIAHFNPTESIKYLGSIETGDNKSKTLPGASLSTSTGEGSRPASTIESQQLPVESVDIDSLAISRVPLQIKEGSGPFSTKVIESTIGKPDDDGDVSVDLKLSLSSYAEEDVELVVSKLVVLTASGLPLLEREDEHDVLITNGASEEISLYSGYFKASQIAGAPVSDTQVLVQLTPCGCKFIDLPQVEIASPGNISGISETLQLLPNVQLRGFSALAPQPDDDGDCRLEFKGLLDNEYESVLNKVVVLIRIIDKNGREIDSTEWSDKVPPFGTVCFDTSLRGIKASRLAGSKVHVSIKAFQCLGNQAISWSVGSKPDPIEVEGGVANAGQQASASPKAPQSLSSDQASSLPSKDLEAGNCNAFDLEITTATYRKPDEDGDTRYEAQYSVINRSDQAIELLMARLFVLHPSGLVVATTEDESEDMAEKGESINASSSTWGTSVKELDGDPSSAQLLLQVTACSCSFQDLGSIECPSSGSTLTLKPKDQHDSGIVVEAITITAELPDDGECCLRIKALIKNKTTSTIPRAVLSTKLISSSGRELEDTYIQEEIAANNEVVLEDALWGVKENRINSASLQFNLKAFTAAGISSVATKNLSVED